MVGIVNNKKLLQIFTSEANAYKILNKQKLKLIDYLAESSDKLVMPNLIDKDFTMTPNKTTCYRIMSCSIRCYSYYTRRC